MLKTLKIKAEKRSDIEKALKEIETISVIEVNELLKISDSYVIQTFINRDTTVYVHYSSDVKLINPAECVIEPILVGKSLKNMYIFKVCVYDYVGFKYPIF